MDRISTFNHTLTRYSNKTTQTTEMKCYTLATLFAAIVYFSMCACHNDVRAVHDGPQYYCGRNLAKALALLCYTNANIPEKRSHGGYVYNAIIPQYYQERQEESRWPWMSGHRARSLSLPSRGKRLIDGVADECCNKACDYSELLSYCG